MDRAAVAAALAPLPPEAGYADGVRAVFAAWAAGRGRDRYGDKTPATSSTCR
jgi:hypothetical protein